MPSRRLFCLGVASALGGCIQQAQPVPDDTPSIETEYLPEQNAFRVWHAGPDALTHIEELLLRVQPRDEAENPEVADGAYGATLELSDGTTHRGTWISTEDQAIAEYPLEPDDEVFVTGYEKSRRDYELQRGDEIDLVAYYPDDHGVVHFRGFAEVP